MNKNPEVRNQRLEYEGRRTREERRSSLPCRQAGTIHHPSSIIYRTLMLVSVFCFFVSTIGCEAFVRKFTRKPKKQELPRQEIVAQPEEYTAPQMTREELYRQYFLYWKSWHDELLEALSAKANHKKQVSCIGEAIKNLEEIRALLNEEKQKKLDSYLAKMHELKEAISDDVYDTNISSSLLKAENIKRNILRDFSYNKIKDYLV